MKALPNSWYIPQIISIGAPSAASARSAVGVAGQVVLDPGLAAVLAAAADEQVRVLGQVLARGGAACTTAS